jgi:hypothetical protein
MRVHDVRIGDEVRRFADRDKHKPGRAFVYALTAWCGSIIVDMRIDYRNGSSRRKAVRLAERAKMMVKREAPHGVACCDQCSREVAEGRHYCVAHWGSWEAEA